MKLREPATKKGGGKAGARAMAASAAAAKRIAATKKSSPVKKAAPAKKAAKKSTPSAKKPAPAKKPTPVAKPAQEAPPRAAAAVSTPTQTPTRAPAARPGGAPVARAPVSSQSPEERRKTATRKFFARLRSLEAIVGADLRKRGSVVLMQAVDQWYSEAISATATDVSITNAAKAVITHL